MFQIKQDYYQESTTPLHRLGQLSTDGAGNRYRYVKNGGSVLVTGNLLQEPAEDTQFVAMAVNATSAIGAKTISVTNGTTTVTANMFDDGILTIASGTGTGQSFRILSHTTGVSGATIVYTVDRGVKIALTVAGSSTVSVRKNPYNGVIQYPVTTQTGGAVGVALYAMTASYYGWVQSGGDCPCLFDTGTNSSNGVSGVGPSSAVAGSVKPQTGSEGGIIIGFSRQIASVDSTHNIVHLNID